MNPKKIIGLSALAALLVVLIVMLCRVLAMVPVVQQEAARTPTPTPLIGNLMVATPAPTDPSATATPAPLKYGSQGESVRQMQQRLSQLGYYQGQTDGKFGNGTRTALKLFQQQHGLMADGVFGAVSSAMLYSAGAMPCVTPTPAPLPTPQPTATPIPQTHSPSYIRQDGLPLLVNADNPLPQDYENYKMVCLNDYCDPDVVIIKYQQTYAERDAVDALMVMLRAAQADGLKTWQISSAYRTVAAQQQLFDKQVKTYMKDNNLSRSKAISATRRTVADPGCSEHHVGTCFDITVPGKTFASTKQSAWLAEHAWEYGFIQRYASGKSSITGILNEAWHYRWVGDEHARIMHDEDLCLQEYIAKYGLTFD